MTKVVHRIEKIYQDADGYWYYDDPSKEVYKEPFVLGTDELIERVCRRFRVLTLQALEFWAGEWDEPEDLYTFKSIKTGEENGGTWYWCDRMRQEFWLCGHLLDYFDKAPEVLMVRVYI